MLATDCSPPMEVWFFSMQLISCDIVNNDNKARCQIIIGSLYTAGQTKQMMTFFSLSPISIYEVTIIKITNIEFMITFSVTVRYDLASGN